MKKNKFMTRVFSAMENQETEVLDQIQNDLEIAREDGELDSEEYKITWDPDQEVFVLHDKINNEHTEISEDEEAAFYMTDMTDANEGIPTPEESIPELSVNDEVKWTDELGHEHQGMITMISDGIATILENEVEVAAPIESLMKVEAPVEEVADVDYTFSEKLEEHDFSFVEKEFSHIDSPESFREYAHKVMKEAHGDDYSEEVTNKVVDDLLADNPNNDYGELIGRLTSGFGEKKFSQFGVAGFKYSSGRPEVITLFVDAKDKKEAKEMFRSKYPTCGQIKAYNWQDNYDHELLADRYKDGFSAPPAPDELSYSFVEKNFGRWDSEKAAVVLKNPDGTHEVVSIQSEDDEERLKSYKEEGCRVVKRCKNTGEADKYIEKKSLTRAYSFIEKTFAKSDAVKKLEFEVSRIKDLYDDVKARQKGETDPVMKSRNKMLLQEIKVKLEQAKLAVYKKEFEESRSKNFSFVERTFSEEFNQPTANLKRAASQWARDLNLGPKGVELIIAAWTDDHQDEFDRLKEELEVSSKDFRIFEEKYYDPNTDKVLY